MAVMKNYIVTIPGILIALLIFCSCGSPDLEGPRNSDGGQTRSNSFEKYGDFYYRMNFVDRFESDDSSGSMLPPLVVSKYQTVVGTIDGSIVLFEGSGIAWEANLDSGSTVASEMCADEDMNIYALSDKGFLYSFEILGKLRWKKPFGAAGGELFIYCDLLAVPEGIVAATNNGVVKMFSHDGKILWEKHFQPDISRKFAADKNGNIILPVTRNTFGATDSLVSISPKGKILWQKAFEGLRIIKNPSVHDDFIAIAAIRDSAYKRVNMIIALDLDGKILWKAITDYLPKYISVSEKGEVYVVTVRPGFGDASAGILRFDNNGVLKNEMYYDLLPTSPVLIAEDMLAMAANSEESFGVVIMKKDCTLKTVHSMSQVPNVVVRPAVKTDGALVFSGVDYLCLVRVDDTFFNKLLPY